MVDRKLIKKQIMQSYHEALKNARTNTKAAWNLRKQLVLGKSKQNKCNFQNPKIRKVQEVKSATTYKSMVQK